jgi:hypothetical protein
LENLQIQIDRLDQKVIVVKQDQLLIKPKDPTPIIIAEIDKIRFWTSTQLKSYPTAEEMRAAVDNLGEEIA